MAILYPDQIDNIYIHGELFTGNVVSVGVDAMYSYDYNHPRTATYSEPKGTLVLIYPGTYQMAYSSSISHRDVLWRGMGDSPTDVVLQSQATYYVILDIHGNYGQVILENIYSYGYPVPYSILFEGGSANTNIYVSKGSFRVGRAAFGYHKFSFQNYRGNAYFSNTFISTDTGKEGQYGYIAHGNATATYSMTNMEYDDPYRCDSCSKSPAPHTYVTTPTTGFGFNYGDFVVSFEDPPPEPEPERDLIEPLYQNVWATTNYIYHTVSSGVDVYNSDASSKLDFISLPTYEEERYVNINVNPPTTESGVEVHITLSGSEDLFNYTNDDGSDIHFKDMSGTELNFWLENWDTVYDIYDIYVWTIASGTDNITMWFGNNYFADYGGGSEADIALFYDGFDGTILDTSKWSVTDGPGDSWVVSNGLLHFQNMAPEGFKTIAIIERQFAPPFRFRTELYDTDGSINGTYAGWAVRLQDIGSASRTGGVQWFNANRYIWTWSPTANQTFTGEGWTTMDQVALDVYFGTDTIRWVASGDREFDITFSGTLSTASRDMQFGDAREGSWDVEFVSVRQITTTTGTISGSVYLDIQQPTSAPTAVWANDSTIYISTVETGVVTADPSDIGTPSGIVTTPYKRGSDITSNYTTYLHGADDYLCVTTRSGVDRYTLSTGSGISTYALNTRKCYQTTSGTLYYIENNPFPSTDEGDLGGSLLDWNYYQYLTFTATSVDDATVRVVLDSSFPFFHTHGVGNDLRFLATDGEVLSYYIDSWFPNAEIIVKVPDAGTSAFYMLYGNAAAAPQSNALDTYVFYDDFTTLDTVNKWHDNSSGNSTVTSNGTYLTFISVAGEAQITTRERIPYSTQITIRIARQVVSAVYILTHTFFGYTSNTSQIAHPYTSTSRGYVRVGSRDIPGSEVPHTLYPYGATASGGDELFSVDWADLTFVYTEGYQESTYRYETLTTSGTDIVGPSNYFTISLLNATNYADMYVDSIKVETWPINYVYDATEGSLPELIKPKLHAVYDPNSNWTDPDYTYTDFYSKPLLLNDVYVTEETSSYNDDNTIFLGSTQGAIVIEERQGDEENSSKKRYFIT